MSQKEVSDSIDSKEEEVNKSINKKDNLVGNKFKKGVIWYGNGD